ncbi:glycoside hydrolase family 15 protein [Microbacterium sp. ASV81]|uniref:Glycoside hydrolase family 15 protein n=1 Tax=Microbacterium capsulatum TaxID=3041921 RepID=A0ABU0XD41_9MICO|nr:glycoside hydrolase family 15 protein [Microbacterium sp. ASV81]MDQ4212872.1 glycoside hydrolase family 15 protein [Microbacterium sp. ASV81]
MIANPVIVSEERLRALAVESVRLINDLQTEEGAYPASPRFSAYVGYSWLRDGAFIADGMSAVGEAASAERFFDWCARVITARRAQIEEVVARAHAGTPTPDGEMLPTRFTFAGGEGGDDWWDFQLDGYGTWIWALGAHLERAPQDSARWREAVELTVDYLTSSWQRPCYDWWEEHSQHVHGSTLAAISAGLRAALGMAAIDGVRAREARTAIDAIAERIRVEGVHEGHLAKWLGSTAVDASLASALAPFGLVDPASDIGARTLDVLDRHLTVDGGTHRYLGDTFFGGGRWPLLSCFLGLAHHRAGNAARARELWLWAASTATDALELPEQVDGHLLAPGMRQEWIDRWGSVATPLLWSHAMFLRLGAELEGDAR